MRAYPRTITDDGAHEIIVKKSRFICTLRRAATEDEARAAIEEVRRIHWDAGHHCTAYCTGPNGASQRTSDDGEPAGTTGAPMLAVLAHRDLTDVVAVETRYFGGVLPDAGGLIRAYGHAVTAAINAVGIAERRQVALVSVDADHADAGRLEHALRTDGYALDLATHAACVAFEMHLAETDLPAFERWLAETTNGRARARVVGLTQVDISVPA